MSFPYYMSNEEFEFILAAIEFIAIYGQRFLPLYHFDWRTGSWSFKINDAPPFNNRCYGTSTGSLCSDTMIVALAKERDGREAGILLEFAENLANAKKLASLLPKFPPQRKVPEEIDISLVPFRV